MRKNESVSTEDLLSVAQRVFTDEGFGVSTGTIARSARVRESALHDRFGSKGDLFLLAMAPPTCDLEEKIRGLSSEGALSGQMEEIALLLFDYFRELAPILFVLATDLDFDYEESLRRHPSLPQVRLQATLVEFLEGHAEVIRVRREALDAAILNLFSLLHSLAFFEALGAHGGRCPEDLIRQQAGLLVKGLLSSAPE